MGDYASEKRDRGKDGRKDAKVGWKSFLYAIERSRKELLKTLQRCERRTEVDVTDVIAATAEQAVGTQKKLPAQQRAER